MLIIPDTIIYTYKDFKPVSLKVYRILKECLFSGVIPTDMKLTEVAVSEALHCSRTPVRTALAQLRNEGLLQNLTKNNFGIKEPEVKDCLDLLDFDVLLEGEAAYLAAQKGVPEEIMDTLEDLNDMLANYRFDSKKDLYMIEYGVRDVHMQFHLLIAKYSGNQYLYKSIVSVRNLMRALRSKAAWSEKNMNNYSKVIAPAHTRILDAIKNRMPDSARVFMRYEILLSRDIYKVADPNPSIS